MEAGNHHNAALLNLEEYAIRETPHSRSTTVAVDYGKLQWMFRYGVNGGFDCQGEALSKVGADVVVPCPCVQQIFIRLRVQTTGMFTVS